MLYALLLTCPGCPTQNAVREIVFREDVLTRLGGMFGPFIVTAGLIALIVDRLQRRAERKHEVKS